MFLVGDGKRGLKVAVTLLGFVAHMLFGLDSLMADLLPAPRGTSFVGGSDGLEIVVTVGTEEPGELVCRASAAEALPRACYPPYACRVSAKTRYTVARRPWYDRN